VNPSEGRSRHRTISHGHTGDRRKSTIAGPGLPPSIGVGESTGASGRAVPHDRLRAPPPCSPPPRRRHCPTIGQTALRTRREGVSGISFMGRSWSTLTAKMRATVGRSVTGRPQTRSQISARICTLPSCALPRVQPPRPALTPPRGCQDLTQGVMLKQTAQSITG